MKLLLNNKEIIFDNAPTIGSLLSTCSIDTKRIAVAVNNNIVHRPMWQDTILADGDNVTVIRAVCGG
jgi:thiamine biosynthesis protein ThiS